MSTRWVADGTLIAAFAAAAAARPDSRFIVASDVRASESRLSDIVADGRRMGARLAALGVRPGDVVGVMLPNWREWLVTCVATQPAGAVMLPIVTIYGAKELGFILRQSRARLVVTPDVWRGADYRARLADCGELPDLLGQVRAGAEFDALVEGPEPGAPPARRADDLALLVYTSGTTADPKGVKHSSRTILAELAVQRESRAKAGPEVVLSPWPPVRPAAPLP